ncbi:MAG: preprotein translocase subunit SecE [Candidatus Paceibacterota bacterium]|jgi:preprotein translocase subunit SecE
MSKLSNYFLETREEMKHVSWPTRKQTFMFTILVIFISVVISAYLGLFDYLFSLGLKGLIY